MKGFYEAEIMCSARCIKCNQMITDIWPRKCELKCPKCGNEGEWEID